MGRFATGKLDRAASCGELSIRVVCVTAERFLEPGDLVGVERGEAQSRGVRVVAEYLAGVDQQDSVRSQSLAGGVELIDVALEAVPERRPAELRRPEALGAQFLRPLQGLLRRGAEQHRRVRRLRVGPGIAQHLPGRLSPDTAEQIPQRDLDAGPCMGCLQQIHAVEGESRSHPLDVLRPVDPLAENRSGYRAAGAVGHRTDEGGDRGQRGGLAFSPADMAAGGDANHQGILAAVAGRGHHGHGEIEEIYAVDFHRFAFLLGKRNGCWSWSRGRVGQPPMRWVSFSAAWRTAAISCSRLPLARRCSGTTMLMAAMQRPELSMTGAATQPACSLASLTSMP